MNTQRRTFFKWVKQVSAGVSLAAAGLSLGAMTSEPAFAASSQSEVEKNTSVVHPYCIPCPDYGTPAGTKCVTDSSCSPQGKIKITYIYTGGCAPAGQKCPTAVKEAACSYC
ncbi:hypothetical protein EI42_06052 [Thermosporothrix hazakensis]|jgi:hypothetical protein|uniref:Secreted protein n=1 Tax=Thermosporothrix hazakensis TaxID=644383 RepID=A0A326TSX6_THEHA|nr:hypothetical protein [Thermosporothrix hazakensis]PZW19493.1 hypothetical protein EI42_06052 [Thermosporothrix hazakensis]